MPGEKPRILMSRRASHPKDLRGMWTSVRIGEAGRRPNSEKRASTRR
ncbi:hypothetical protein CORC01_06360 [Colletotrichum orchidophilum]|uniref:Uncharacterized protein n=1 Tax=Colletotrichum orchidophilum TaxID=1209926 RepID=A0A1G4BAD5_9PEZI|nr:uncharacterized protein CORC01_06360 [Colletotrichum orchidophilum]OHE98364.1 hypothetical protein CORC01_06360 [Colletotrichum orchidophilum]